jgi:hypothetical protein
VFWEKVEDPAKIKPNLVRVFESGKPAVLEVGVQMIPQSDI